MQSACLSLFASNPGQVLWSEGPWRAMKGLVVPLSEQAGAIDASYQKGSQKGADRV